MTSWMWGGGAPRSLAQRVLALLPVKQAGRQGKEAQGCVTMPRTPGVWGNRRPAHNQGAGDMWGVRTP